MFWSEQEKVFQLLGNINQKHANFQLFTID